MNLIDDTHEAIELIASRASKRARRRSIDRRKHTILEAQDTIGALETKLRDAKIELQRKKISMNKLSGVLLSFEKGAATKEVCRTLHNILEAKQNQFKGLEGMHTWTLDFSDKNEMYVHFHGIVPETCISVSLRVKSSAAVACKAELTRTQ